MSVQGCLVLVIALGAAWMDLLWEKVTNPWIWISWAVGLIYQISSYGPRGIGVYIGGMLTPILVLLPLFLFRMMGAGDVKLFSALGGIIGFSAILQGIALSFLFGAILSAAFVIVCGNLSERLWYFANYITRFSHTKTIVPYYRRGQYAENIHFTIPVLLGMMLYVGGFY